MKLLFTIALLLKRFGIILRGLGVVLCFVLLILEAIPDLKYNFLVGKTKSYTEKQIIETKKEELPLYLKISDVEPVGEMYITEMYQKKNETPRLSAIIYPVYNLKKGINNIDKLKKSPCNIVVKDPDVNENTLSTYFDKKYEIEGKFDQSLIDDETKKLLVEGGYNIADNCILIKKGAKVWSSTTCILMIVGFGFVGLLILLSLLPLSILHKIFKQEQRFERIK
mgnify:FL=1|tara:strand:+ start:633 stop:1304 length:672 start_codon:yes stop_codon:yes gene_type:complete